MDADNFWIQPKVREIKRVSSGYSTSQFSREEKIPKPHPTVKQIWKCLQACTQKSISWAIHFRFLDLEETQLLWNTSVSICLWNWSLVTFRTLFLSLSLARYSIWIPSKCQPAYLEGGGWGAPMPCFVYKTDLNILILTEQGNMSLTAKDKDIVKAFWTKVSGRADEIGCEAVSR